MNTELKRIFKIDMSLQFITGLIIFMNFLIWNEVETFFWFYVHFLVYFLSKYITMPIAMLLAIKGRLVHTVRAAFIFYFATIASIAFYIPLVEHPLLVILGISPLIAGFSSFRGVGINNLIAKRGQGKEFRDYAVKKDTISKVIAVFLPLGLGAILNYWGMPHTLILMVIAAMVGMMLTIWINDHGIEIKKDRKEFFDDLNRIKFRDILGREKVVMHTIFIFAGGYILQFSDINRNLLTIANSGGSDWLFGLFTSFASLLTTILYFVYQKTNIQITTWFRIGAIWIALSIVILWFSQSLVAVSLSLALLVLGFFLVAIVYNSITFELTQGLTDYEKLIALFKRDMYAVTAKVSLVITGMFFAFESLDDSRYVVFTLLMLILLSIMVMIHERMRKELNK